MSEQLLADMGHALQEAQAKIGVLEANIQALKSGSNKPKINKPSVFSGKQNVESWITHMRSYLQGCGANEALPIAVSYLGGAAHEWWLARLRDGTNVANPEQLFQHLHLRFNVINKEKLARDKLHRWKQMKDVQMYNEDFQKIILDIPTISKEEQIDRYTRGLKPYIWREMCTKDYKELVEAMRDTEKIESAHHRGGNVRQNHGPRNVIGRPAPVQAPVPMEIGNIRLQKLTPEERQRCFRMGLCFRCRQPGHNARDRRCPKNANRN